MRTITPEERARQITRQEQVLVLVRLGKSYREIGRELGVSHHTVAKDLEVALKEYRRPSAEGVMKLHVQRAEWIWKQAAEIANTDTNPDRRLRALDRCSAALERLAKLDGVDAPTRQNIEVFTHDAFAEAMAALESEVIALQKARPELVIDTTATESVATNQADV